eukprot:149325-Amorphochlora_amoeboformis.AAC.1
MNKTIKIRSQRAKMKRVALEDLLVKVGARLEVRLALDSGSNLVWVSTLISAKAWKDRIRLEERGRDRVKLLLPMLAFPRQ